MSVYVNAQTYITRYLLPELIIVCNRLNSAAVQDVVAQDVDNDLGILNQRKLRIPVSQFDMHYAGFLPSHYNAKWHKCSQLPTSVPNYKWSICSDEHTEIILAVMAELLY